MSTINDQRIQKLHEMGFEYDDNFESFAFGHLSISKWEVESFSEEEFNAKIMDFQNVMEE